MARDYHAEVAQLIAVGDVQGMARLLVEAAAVLQAIEDRKERDRTRKQATRSEGKRPRNPRTRALSAESTDTHSLLGVPPSPEPTAMYPAQAVPSAEIAEVRDFLGLRPNPRTAQDSADSADTAAPLPPLPPPFRPTPHQPTPLTPLPASPSSREAVPVLAASQWPTLDSTLAAFGGREPDNAAALGALLATVPEALRMPLAATLATVTQEAMPDAQVRALCWDWASSAATATERPSPRYLRTFIDTAWRDLRNGRAVGGASAAPAKGGGLLDDLTFTGGM